MSTSRYEAVQELTELLLREKQTCTPRAAFFVDLYVGRLGDNNAKVAATGVCTCVFVCVCACVRVCVKEKERERATDSLCHSQRESGSKESGSRESAYCECS